jgi:hypothetical protein
MTSRNVFYLAIALLCAHLPCARAQQSDSAQGGMGAKADSNIQEPKRPLCPGGFPTDLTVVNCSYTISQRRDDFITGSVSDQAVLGAVVFGAGAQIIQSPAEWKRTWDGYGRRVGVRYNQAVAKGAAEFLVGAALSEDPRHVSYRNDPRFVNLQRDRLSRMAKGESVDADPYVETSVGVWKRIGHALYDSVSDRRSSLDGNGPRMPAVSRFVGAFASGYGGYAWYKQPENTFSNAGLRAAQSFGTDIAASFYTEFSPDISKLLGAILKRGRQKTP